jgi:predicted nucleotidyltransferase
MLRFGNSRIDKNDCKEHVTSTETTGASERYLNLARARGAYNIRVFGSVAQGEETENSDVDILVDLAPGRTIFDLGGLLHDLQNVLDCNVDVVTEKGLRQRIRQEILAEAIPL